MERFPLICIPEMTAECLFILFYVLLAAFLKVLMLALCIYNFVYATMF
jgi:hypothetical protein